MRRVLAHGAGERSLGKPSALMSCAGICSLNGKNNIAKRQIKYEIRF